MDFSAVQTAIATLKADFDTFSADVTAKLTALAANQQNPADAATLAGVVTSLQGIDASIKAADAAVNPPSGGPA